MGDEGEKPEGEGDKQTNIHTYPLVKFTDMNDEQKAEVIDISVSACEKFSSNYELAAKSIKEKMDAKFGVYWHVVVGEGFGFEVAYQLENILYLFFGGNLGIIVWKCS